MKNQTLVVALMLTIAGCSTLPNSNKVGELRGFNASTVQEDQLKSIDATRQWQLSKLEKEYEAVKAEMKTALNYANFNQRRDYVRRKNWGVIGSIFGITATALNAASSANLVTSTVFTGLQTATIGAITTEDGLVDPQSYQAMKDFKDEVNLRHKEYINLWPALANTQDPEWDVKYATAVSILQDINFKCFSILPPKEGLLDTLTGK